MGKKKKELGFDSDGAKKVMRKRDYMADMSGQWALGLMANVLHTSIQTRWVLLLAVSVL